MKNIFFPILVLFFFACGADQSKKEDATVADSSKVCSCLEPLLAINEKIMSSAPELEHDALAELIQSAERQSMFAKDCMNEALEGKNENQIKALQKEVKAQCRKLAPILNQLLLVPDTE